MIQSTTKQTFVNTGAQLPTQQEILGDADRLKGLLENKLARFPSHPRANTMVRLVAVLTQVESDPKEYGLDQPEGILGLQRMMQGVVQLLSDNK